MTSDEDAPAEDDRSVVFHLRAELAAERAMTERLRKQWVWACDQLQSLSNEACIQEARASLSLKYLNQIRERERALFGQVAETRRRTALAEERQRRTALEAELTTLREELAARATPKEQHKPKRFDGGRLQAQAVGLLQGAGRNADDAWGVWEQSRMESTLDVIRQAEGASTAVLSDAFGLPVAVVGDEVFTDALAALAGVAQAFASNAGALLPFQGIQSLIVEDELGGTASYTLFEQDGERFLLALLTFGRGTAQNVPSHGHPSSRPGVSRLATMSPPSVRTETNEPSPSNPKDSAKDSAKDLTSGTYALNRQGDSAPAPAREARRGHGW